MNQDNKPYWIGKEFWGEGPWQNEPDAYEDIYNNHVFILIRNLSGTWCGYVRIDDPSFLTGKDIEYLFDVHGGITYQGYKRHPDYDKDGSLWIGFDCNHLDDFWPVNYEVIMGKITKEYKHRYKKPLYRTIDFAKNQCHSLIDQVICVRKEL